MYIIHYFGFFFGFLGVLFCSERVVGLIPTYKRLTANLARSCSFVINTGYVIRNKELCSDHKTAGLGQIFRKFWMVIMRQTMEASPRAMQRAR